MIERFSATIRDAAARGSPLRLRGAGTKDFYGERTEGAILDTREHAGIVAYEPTELVVTARCGTPLEELESALAQRGQMLAFEPPHFGDGATVGGCVAAGLSGPRRASAGALRDFVLGVKLMDGRGQVLGFGGQVMKNVAGYDVSRLTAGAMGTLGLILEVSLKVLPRPQAELTLLMEMPQDRAIEIMNQWSGRPLPVSATYWHNDELMVRLSGASAAVDSARQQLGGEIFPGGEAFWAGLREHRPPIFRDGGALWRLSVPSVAPPLPLPGTQLIEWGGALRWLRTEAESFVVREAARAVDGHATLFRGGDPHQDVFDPLPAPLMKLHRGLKQSFDPHGILNRGRMYPDF